MAGLAVTDSERTQRALYEALRQGTLLVPAAEPLPEPTGWQVTTQPQTVRPATVEGWGGEQYLVVFTSEAAFLRCQPQGGPYLSMPTRDLSRLVLANAFAGIVLNKESPISVIVRREEIEMILEGVLPKGESTGQEGL